MVAAVGDGRQQVIMTTTQHRHLKWSEQASYAPLVAHEELQPALPVGEAVLCLVFGGAMPHAHSTVQHGHIQHLHHLHTTVAASIIRSSSIQGRQDSLRGTTREAHTARHDSVRQKEARST